MYALPTKENVNTCLFIEVIAYCLAHKAETWDQS